MVRGLCVKRNKASPEKQKCLTEVSSTHFATYSYSKIKSIRLERLAVDDVLNAISDGFNYINSGELIHDKIVPSLSPPRSN